MWRIKIRKTLTYLVKGVFGLVIISSCGLRQDTESFDNVLIGSWKLSEIKCYNPNYSTGDRLERYILSQYVKVEMIFEARTFKYAVTESTPFLSNCITSAQASYKVSFANQSKGTTTYLDFNLSSGCNINLDETSGGSPVSVPFGLSGLSEDSSDIFWAIDENGYLILESSTGFHGSAVGSLCDSSCLCYGFFQKQT